MKRRRSFVGHTKRAAAVAVAASIAACGATAPATTQPGAGPSGATSASVSASAAIVPQDSPTKTGEQNATIRLLDAGAAPRRVVRYRFNASQPETATLDLQTAYKVEGGPDSEQATTLPLVRFTVAIEPKSVTPDGVLHFEYRLASTEVVPTPSSKPELTTPMDALVKSMRGLTGTGDTSATGLTTHATFDAPDGASALIEEMIGHIRQTMRGLVMSFPEEAVGIGAKWLKTWGSNVEETYTLVELAGDTGKLDVRMTVKGGGSSAAKTVDVRNIASTGTGAATFDLRRITPTYGSNHVTTASVMDREGDRRTVNMTMNMTVRISGTTR